MTPWQITADGPVVAPGRLHPEHDAGRAGAAHVVALDGRLCMLYWGTDGQGRHAILRAEASPDDPCHWHPVGSPLLGPQPDTQHNSIGPSFPHLHRVEGAYWLLYCAGWGVPRDGRLPNTTSVAISEDAGRSWRYHDANPVIPLDRPYDREGTGSCCVVRERDTFRMYYTAIGRYFAKPEGVRTGHGDVIPEIGIAYAESDDGITWCKPLEDLVVRPRGFDVEPYEYICSKPFVMRNGPGYVMWVNTFGTAYRVRRLTSADGLTWRWADRVGPDGELGIGTAGAFDDHQRCYPTMLRIGDEVQCWFTGNGFGATGMGHAVLAGPLTP